MPKYKPFNDYKVLDDETAEFYIDYLGERLSYQVDIEDLYRLIKLNKSWHVQPSHGHNYASWSMRYTGEDGKRHGTVILLHRWILNYDNDDRTIVVDHKNHNEYNNKKENLRVTKATYNSMNRKSKNINNQTGYRNVSFVKGDETTPYYVQLQIDGINTVLGKFSDVDEAGDYAEKMRQKYYGKFKGKN